MQKELLNHAINLFDSHEKWNAFLELTNQKGSITDYYFQQVKQPLTKYFNENPVEGWVCEPWGDKRFDLRWYLKDFGNNSICLAIGWRFEFHLLLDDLNSFDTKKVNELLKSDYSLLLASFDRVDRQFEANAKIMENRNYIFGGPYDSNFDNTNLEKLAWYAGNRTQDFADQIIRKVEKFRQDKNLTKMLYELNERSKIQLM